MATTHQIGHMATSWARIARLVSIWLFLASHQAQLFPRERCTPPVPLLLDSLPALGMSFPSRSCFGSPAAPAAQQICQSGRFCGETG